MKYERDTEWPDKLQPAVFAANTQFKRFTAYTPFRLMFGRECDPFGLIKLITGTPEGTEIQEGESIDDGIQVQWCSRNSKSHFARNLLANRRTNLTLVVRLGTKVTC